MPRKALTARFVETVKADKRTDYWDDIVRGLVLRVSETGVKSWTVVYVGQNDGTKRRLTLGKFPAIKLDKARTLALKTVAAVAEGENPAGDKQAKRQAMTVAELGSLFIDKYAKRNKKTWQEDERILRVEVYPAIGRMKAEAVKRRDLLDILEAKQEAGSPGQSRMILATVRKMFNWSVEGDYLPLSPATGLKPISKPVRRDRVLSPAETASIWNALPDASLTAEVKDIIRFLFLTGQRSGEVSGIRRGEVDLDAGIWALPAERVKNGLAHNVPLSSAAAGIISARIDSDMEADAPLFSRVGDAPIEAHAISQAVRKQLQITNERWTPHDIRRTVATGMADIGIQPHIIEATLNHISGFRAGVAGVYNRAAYDREKRNALDRWAEHLDRIVTGKAAKVVPLKAGA